MPKILDAAVLEAYRQVDMDEVRAVSGVVALTVPKEKLELTAEVIVATSNQAMAVDEENRTDEAGGTDKAEPSNAGIAQSKSEAPISESEAGARAMLAMKQKYPSFKRVDFFWLDDLVDKITFGKSRALTVHWKYGGKTTVTMQIANTKDDPIYVAGLIRQKRDKARAEEALLERASDLMASAICRARRLSRPLPETRRNMRIGPRMCGDIVVSVVVGNNGEGGKGYPALPPHNSERMDGGEQYYDSASYQGQGIRQKEEGCRLLSSQHGQG